MHLSVAVLLGKKTNISKKERLLDPAMIKLVEKVFGFYLSERSKTKMKVQLQVRVPHFKP